MFSSATNVSEKAEMWTTKGKVLPQQSEWTKVAKIRELV
jgi:hypothetical protein